MLHDYFSEFESKVSYLFFPLRTLTIDISYQYPPPNQFWLFICLKSIYFLFINRLWPIDQKVVKHTYIFFRTRRFYVCYLFITIPISIPYDTLCYHSNFLNSMLTCKLIRLMFVCVCVCLNANVHTFSNLLLFDWPVFNYL